MDNQDKNVDEQQKRQIPNWLRNTLILMATIISAVVVLSMIGLIIYTNVYTDKTVSIDTSTIVSVVLAIFSIWLAVKFYMEATRTSNKFYDSTYEFMRSQSNLVTAMDTGLNAKINSLEKAVELASEKIKDKGEIDYGIKEGVDEYYQIISEYLKESKNKDANKDEYLMKIEKSKSKVDKLIDISKNVENELFEIIDEVNEHINYDSIECSLERDYIGIKKAIREINFALQLTDNRDAYLMTEIYNLINKKNWYKSNREEILSEYEKWLNTSDNELNEPQIENAVSKLEHYLSLREVIDYGLL